MSASRAVLEQVNFDTSKITSIDWRTYPILRFQDIPPAAVVTAAAAAPGGGPPPADDGGGH